MTNTASLTDEQVDAAMRKWGDTSDSRVVVDIIIGTNLRDHVVGRYLEWLDTTMARPNLRQMLKDEEAGKLHLSSSAYFLATLVANIKGGGTQPVDLTKLWNLDRNNREVVVRALATGLKVTL